MVSKTNFWIFQANPKYYNMVGALEEYLTMDFTVTRYRKEIKPEDTVFIWISGKDAGIYAIAKTLSSPYVPNYPYPTDPFEKVCWNKIENTMKVDIEILHVLERPLLKNRLIEIPELSKLLIIAAPQVSNFRVSNNQSELLLQLIQMN